MALFGQGRARAGLRRAADEPGFRAEPAPLPRFLHPVGASELRLRLQPRTRAVGAARLWHSCRSEEHTSELQSLMRISYAVFCLKKKKYQNTITIHQPNTCIATQTITTINHRHFIEDT